MVVGDPGDIGDFLDAIAVLGTLAYLTIQLRRDSAATPARIGYKSRMRLDSMCRSKQGAGYEPRYTYR